MTSPDLPAKFGNDAVLSAATPGGLPYPVSGDPANQGANAIKALALAVDTAQGDPWVVVPLTAGYTGNLYVRREGSAARIAGAVTGAYSGSPTFGTIPVGYRPVFPTGLTYYAFILAAASSGVNAFCSVRVWGNGAIVMVAVNGSMTNADFGAINYSIRNG